MLLLDKMNKKKLNEFFLNVYLFIFIYIEFNKLFERIIVIFVMYEGYV